MSRKLWADAAKKFRRERMNPAVKQLRRDFKLKASHIQTGLMQAFSEGFLSGYNASNEMHSKKAGKK